MRKGAARIITRLPKLAYRLVEQIVFAAKLGIGKQERVALASFPRSGNTWLRYLLEEATGEKCGSIYSDETIMARLDQGIAIKTHKLDAFKYSRAIHLVRNPFVVLESYFNWKMNIRGVRNIKWSSFLQRASRQWAKHTRYWLNVSCDTFILKYEDLHSGPETQLENLLRWMGMAVSREDIDRAVEKASFDNMRSTMGTRVDKEFFFRRGEISPSPTMYSEKDIAIVERAVGPYLERLNYSKPEVMR